LEEEEEEEAPADEDQAVKPAAVEEAVQALCLE